MTTRKEFGYFMVGFILGGIVMNLIYILCT